MSSKYRYFAVAMLLSIGAALVAPVAGAAQAQPRGRGEALSSFRAFDIALTGIPSVGDISASLGVARLDASTMGTPVANIVIEAIRSGSQRAGTYSASSTDPNSSQSVTFPFDGPVTSGQISIADLIAMSDSDSARAALGALETSLEIGPLGIWASSPRQGIEAVADRYATVSSTGFAVGPFGLSVGDLLPPELLEALPLSVVWDLAKKLPVDATEELRSAIRSLRDLIDSVDAIETASALLNEAQAELDVLTDGNSAVQTALAAVESAEDVLASATANLAVAEGEVAAAQSEIDSAQATLDGLIDQKAILDEQLALCSVPLACSGIQSQIDAITTQITDAQTQLTDAQSVFSLAQAQLDAAQTQLDAAEAALADAVQTLEGLAGVAITELENLVDELEAQLVSLLTSLEELIASIPNLSDLISDVVFEIAGTSLFVIGKIEVKSLTQADATDASGDVGCRISGSSVLGQAIPNTNCDAIKQAFGDVRAAIRGVLQALPVSGVPEVSIDGLNTYTESTESPDANGWATARAGLSALHVELPSVALVDVADQLVANAIEQLEAIVGTDVAGAALESLLGQLQAQLDTLPVGDALAGLRTVGVQASMAEVANFSRFRADNAVIAPIPNPRDPTDPSGPTSDPRPHAPAPMPFTGHELTYWAVMATVLLTIGAMAWHVGRRWEQLMESYEIAGNAKPTSSSQGAATASSGGFIAPAAAVATVQRAVSSKTKTSARKKSSSPGSKQAAARSTTTKARPASSAKSIKPAASRSKTPAAKATSKRVVVRKTTVRRPAPRKAAAAR